jgi:hypothetical protein
MSYKIQYFRASVVIGETPWAEPLDKTKEVAAAGLIRHNAEYAAILDMDDEGKLVATVKRRA